MSKVKANGKLDLREALKKGILQLHAGYTGFFLSTEFGLIGVEAKKHSDGAMRWKDAPATKFTMDNRRVEADFYIGIKFKGCLRQDEKITEFYMTQYIATCYAMSVLNESYRFGVDEVVADAFTQLIAQGVADSSYMYDFTSGREAAELIGRDKYPFPFMRQNRIYRDFITANTTIYDRRIKAARDYIGAAKSAYTSHGFSYGDFGSGEFYEFVVGVVIIHMYRYEKYMTKEFFDKYMEESSGDKTPHEAVMYMIKKAREEADKPIGDTAASNTKGNDGKDSKKGGSKNK